MAKENIICGLDIGTSNIKAVVAQVKFGQNKPQILGTGLSSSLGMRKGVVVDVGEVVKNIKQSVEEAERTSGLPFEHAYVNIGGNHISCRSSKGVIAVSRADGEISEEDILRAVQAAEAIAIPQNREILHTIVRYFTVDGEEFIKDPVGMSGVRLEANVLIIEGSTPFIKNLTKCLNEADIEIDGLVLSNLAASRAVLSKRQKELGVLVLDLGGGTTNLTVFEEGDTIHTGVLPVGSGHITNDLAIGLRISIDLAEKLKLGYGSALADEIDKKEVINLSKLDEGEEGIVSRRYLSEIIQSRLNEIFDLVNKELKKIDRQGLLPAGLVMVGGGAKLPGLVDLAKDRLGLPAQIGSPINIDGVIDRVDDPFFATAVGLILWGMDEEEKGGDKKTFIPFLKTGNPLTKIFRWLKTFLP